MNEFCNDGWRKIYKLYTFFIWVGQEYDALNAIMDKQLRWKVVTITSDETKHFAEKSERFDVLSSYNHMHGLEIKLFLNTFH